MEKSRALNTAQRRANETQENFVVYKTTNNQWMFVSESYMNGDGKEFTYKDIKVIRPNFYKPTFDLIDESSDHRSYTPKAVLHFR